MEHWPLLIFAGMAGGFLAGLLGVGGGIIFVFALHHHFTLLGIEGTELTRFILANSLFATFFSGITATIRNWRKGQFYPRETLLMGLPGAATVMVVAYSITQYNWFTPKAFSIVFVLLLLFTAYRMVFSAKKKEGKNRSLRAPVLVASGMLAAIISGLSGLGGGVIVVPLLNQRLQVPLPKASSISLGVIPLLAFGSSIFYLARFSPANAPAYSLGYMHFPSALPLALGIILFAPLGGWAAQYLSNALIKIIFGALLLVVALKLVYSNWL